jgi:hypothetical protein
VVILLAFVVVALWESGNLGTVLGLVVLVGIGFLLLVVAINVAALTAIGVFDAPTVIGLLAIVFGVVAVGALSTRREKHVGVLMSEPALPQRRWLWRVIVIVAWLASGPLWIWGLAPHR